MKKGLLFAVIAVLIVTGLSHKSYADGIFRDISDTHWAKDEINSMVQQGILEGYSDRTFRPDKKITREEFAKLITNSFYLDLPPADQAPTFVDVAENRWSFTAIEAAKDFLTGYYPPSGKAFFDPKGEATREDVAVALVKTLGYQPSDLVNKQILNRFYDEHLISRNVETYVALAVENKLMVGDSRGNFNPTKALTRSEAAVLLYRAIKGAVGDEQQELELNVSAPETVSSPTFYITGDTANNARVYINNKEAEVVNGQFRVSFRLSETGTYTYKVTARLPGGKSRSITKTVTYQKGAPTLEVTGVPEKTSNQYITVKWVVKDENDRNPIVYVNGEEQRNYYNQSSKEIKLVEGSNEIVVEARNDAGKTTKVVKTVVFSSGGPVLRVENIPATTNKDTIVVRWTVTDPNDRDPSVYVNEQMQYGNSASIGLKKGNNVLTVKAVNKLGKVTEQTYQVVFENSGSVLKVNPIEATTNREQLTISWTVNDPNDHNPVVSVNNNTVYSNKATVSLKPGANTIQIKVTNKHGDTISETLTTVFEPSAPTLTLGYAPETTTSKYLTLTWHVDDINDNRPQVYVNDRIVSYNSSYVELVPGNNTFKIVASNKFGKITEHIYNVVYEGE